MRPLWTPQAPTRRLPNARLAVRGAPLRTSLPIGLLLLASVAIGLLFQASPAAAAAAAGGTKTIHFHGREVSVPRHWPVHRLAEHPRMCVRLDRRAVYLGTPSPGQRCPASAIGRRRAILVDPDARSAATASAGPVPLARLEAGSDFTGLGFDACAAPSKRAMSAWGSSPYRAVGVYIGGLNRACAQPNLTAAWVREQTGRGWSLIPTYVGLQAPTSDCSSCAKLSPATASSQGSAAAADAVSDARAIGIGPGSPIYFDMESYARTSSSTAATLSFLASWTSRLHALGYVSGVYSSSASGIADLADRLGSGYLQPDDLWIANWNGSQSTADPFVPAGAWSRHQRIHQYRGGHDETYGGVTINIDNDYVDGATVGDTSSDDDPRGHFDFAGSPQRGQVRVVGWAFDPSAPTEPVAIRAYVGGRAGARGAARYELGAVADLGRPDVAESHQVAGGDHGFDASFATVKSGREPICVYALDLGPGADSLLGCRTIVVPVAISISRIVPDGGGLWVTVRCEWPAGTQCPGQLLLRARVAVRVRVRHRGRRATRVRVARRAVARRGFKLTGGRSHAFRIRLGRRGRKLTGGRRLPAQLVVAIPGGRRVKPVVLRPR